jgi:rubrerythrin
MDPGFIKDLTDTINGEYTAINCYKRLIDNAPNNEQKERITEIRRDEMRHFEMFSKTYITLTGVNPNPQMVEDCPEKYCDGLEAAFHDEQKAVDFYHRMAEKANDPAIKEQYLRAAGDEQNHAVWFLYFFMIECHHHH